MKRLSPLMVVAVLALAIPAAAGAHVQRAQCLMMASPYITHPGFIQTSVTAATTVGTGCRTADRLARAVAHHWHAKKVDGFSIRRVYWTHASEEVYGDMILTKRHVRIRLIGVCRIVYFT